MQIKNKSGHFCFISSMAGSPWGGSEELWSQAALRLSAQGHQISQSVFWWPQLSPHVLAVKKAAAETLIWKTHNSRNLLARLWQKLKWRFNSEDERRKWLRRQAPDLTVISQGGSSDGLEWMKICRELNMPFVTVLHCNHEGWWPSDETAETMAQVYHAARKLFCVSRHNLELLECHIGEPVPGAEVIWNPCKVFANKPPAWPDEKIKMKLACVARLEPVAKGQDLLLKVLALPQWRARPVELNIYGSGPNENGLRKLAETLQLNNVHFHGHVGDTQKIWSQNHLLVLPSRYEGLPLVLVEAMWCERPAVVTDVGGNAELCTDGETGFVAAAPAVNLVAEALERAWNRRDELPNMGKAAHARVDKLVAKDAVGDFCTRLIELAKI
jgi:glycosyltransferase involved in cell wall biosynthesis